MGNRLLGTFQLFHPLSLLIFLLLFLHFERVEPGEVPSRPSVLESALEIVYLFPYYLWVVLWLLVLAFWVIHTFQADPIKVGTDALMAGTIASSLKSWEQ
jgi:hypothetical protein